MAGRFSVEAVFKAVDKITAPVTRMQNRVGKMTRSMTRGLRTVNRAMGRVTKGIRRGAKKAAVSLALVGGALYRMLGAGVDFEQAITNVGAVGLKTRAEIAPLEELALRLGRTTKFTATQSANAMETLAKAGFNVQQILKATPAVLSAAAASGLEIAEVSGHVSNVLKGMGLEMDQAARVADVLALASARTNSTIGSLGESMKNAAATSRMLGVPLEDVIASVALLQDVGLDASVAGSAFNVMLTKMAAPSNKIKKIMRRLGVSFKDAKGNMKALPSVIADISKASKAMGGNFDQVAFLAELVGLRGQKAASNLANLFETGKLKELTEELRNASGSANKMANLRMDTVQGSMLLLGSAVDAVKVKIFGLNNGALRDLIDQTTRWVSLHGTDIAEKIGGFLLKVIKNLKPIAKWIKKIGIGLAVFYAFTAVLKTLILVMLAVNLVMAANPVVLIVLAFIALVAAIAAAIIWWDKLKAAFKSLPAPAKAAIAILAGPIGWLVNSASVIMDNWKPIKKFFADLWSDVARIFDSTIGAIMLRIDAMKKVIKTITGLGNKMKSPPRVTTPVIDTPAKDAGFFGKLGKFFSSDAGRSQIVSPQERTANSIDERITREKAEITIRDESGRAEITGGGLGNRLQIQPSGAF